MSAPHGYVGYEDGKGRPRTCEEAEAELTTVAAAVAREWEIIAAWCETQARWFTVCRPPRPEAAAVYAEVAAQIRSLP